MTQPGDDPRAAIIREYLELVARLATSLETTAQALRAVTRALLGRLSE